EVAIGQAARRHLVRVVAVEVRVAVRVMVEEPAAHERARKEKERRPGQCDEPLHRRTAEKAPTPTAASAHVSTSTAPTFRCGPSQAQAVLMISLRFGSHDVPSAGRTPQVTGYTGRNPREARRGAGRGFRPGPRGGRAAWELRGRRAPRADAPCTRWRRSDTRDGTASRRQPSCTPRARVPAAPCRGGTSPPRAHVATRS